MGTRRGKGLIGDGGPFTEPLLDMDPGFHLDQSRDGIWGEGASPFLGVDFSWNSNDHVHYTL